MARMFEALILSAFAGIFCANPAPAQTTAWRIDSVHSTARLYVGSSNRKDARINVGVARLSGELLQSAGNFLPSSFTFQIYPADKNAKPAQSQGGGSAAVGSGRAGSTVIAFQSKTVELINENSLRVRGELTATYVSRAAEYDGLSKGYSGPTFGPPITHSMKRVASFVFRVVPNSGTQEAKRGNPEWTATSAFPNQAFPELWNAVVTTDWPAFVLGEQCTAPSGIGEDFSGPACTGKVVEPAPRTDALCAMPSEVGEDFTGVVCSGTPLLALPKREEANGSGGSQAAGNSDQTIANEVEIELVVRLAKANTVPQKPPARSGDPTARNYGGFEAAGRVPVHLARQ